MPRIRVFVVDDSAVVRQVASAVLGADPDIVISGVAPDLIFALDKMRRDWPDRDRARYRDAAHGRPHFLRKIMAERPTPVVICSSLTTAGAQSTMEALAAGAVGIVPNLRLAFVAWPWRGRRPGGGGEGRRSRPCQEHHGTSACQAERRCRSPGADKALNH